MVFVSCVHAIWPDMNREINAAACVTLALARLCRVVDPLPAGTTLGGL